MLDLGNREKDDPEEKKAILLEFLAASAIFSLVAIVLYMVFTYKAA